jgi:hypothetical protein
MHVYCDGIAGTDGSYIFVAGLVEGSQMFNAGQGSFRRLRLNKLKLVYGS